MFTDQANMAVDCDIHLSLHANCRHQINYTRFNLNIHYVRPYIWRYLDYEEPDSDHIKKATERINWE